MRLAPLLVTQRVYQHLHYPERRDALDQRWPPLLMAAGFLPVIVPNHIPSALGLAAAVDPVGLLLTGGNDPVALGGDAPERDRVETALIEWAMAVERPVLGICRGMEMLLIRYGTDLVRVEGHVRVRQRVALGQGRSTEIMCYHSLAAHRLAPPLVPLAVAVDTTIEAFQDEECKVAGIMWHPEREEPSQERDIKLLKSFFATGRLEIEP